MIRYVRITDSDSDIPVKTVVGDKSSRSRINIYISSNGNTDICFCYNSLGKRVSMTEWFDDLSPLDKEEFIWNFDYFSALDCSASYVVGGN